jgi:hypothetical protein
LNSPRNKQQTPSEIQRLFTARPLAVAVHGVQKMRKFQAFFSENVVTGANKHGKEGAAAAPAHTPPQCLSFPATNKKKMARKRRKAARTSNFSLRPSSNCKNDENN